MRPFISQIRVFWNHSLKTHFQLSVMQWERSVLSEVLTVLQGGSVSHITNKKQRRHVCKGAGVSLIISKPCWGRSKPVLLVALAMGGFLWWSVPGTLGHFAFCYWKKFPEVFPCLLPVCCFLKNGPEHQWKEVIIQPIWSFLWTPGPFRVGRTSFHFFPLWWLVQQLAKYPILLGRTLSYQHVLPFHGRNHGSRNESSVVMLN